CGRTPPRATPRARRRIASSAVDRVRSRARHRIFDGKPGRAVLQALRIRARLREMIDPTIERLAIDLAARVREAVAPSLGTADARAGVGVAPGGDVTMAIDEIAERVVEETCTAAGDIAF